MKKALSIFLAVIMLMSVMSLAASAVVKEPGVCMCEDHNRTGPCHCCIYCEHLDVTYKLDCCKKETLYNGDEVWTFCCPTCTGLWNCECVGCSCCSEKTDDMLDDGSTSLIPPSTQNSLVKAFQNAINKIKAVFDSFFDSIFEFLRIDDFFGE